MKETELQELERALRAASPVPWRAEKTPYYTTYHCAVVDANEFTVVTDDAGDGSDTEAIAALRNAAPPLISDLREARRLLGQARDHLRSEHQCASNEPAEIDTFLGERSDREQSEPPAVPNRSESTIRWPFGPGEQKT